MIKPKPILNHDLSAALDKAVVMFEKKTLWKQIGMNRLREQGAALLFHGKPGTGKTITAQWLAKKLNLMLQTIDFSQIGSDTPGELSRNIQKLFATGAVEDVRGNPSMIFVDECDTVLVARNLLGHDNLWMLEPINAMLQEIGKYKGLIILATNMKPTFLDHALERRLLGIFEFTTPDYLTRCQIWQDKFPKKFPIKPTQEQYELLADAELTGAEIENQIILWISNLLLTYRISEIKQLRMLGQETIRLLMEQILKHPVNATYPIPTLPTTEPTIIY
jgi:AAA+ superfamily predicted ATPase